MEFYAERRHIIAFVVAIGILIADLGFWRGTPLFVPGIIIAVTVAWFQYWIDYFRTKSQEREFESNFLEFVRNLVGAVKSGMPVSNAIIHVSDSDYGPLTPYVKKLAHQVEWAIPVHRALVNFGNATRNSVIKRAISTVIEAEQSGGNIEDVLTSITESLVEIKRIAQERRTSIHGQVIQSYVIFFVFLGVMIVIQNLLIPYISGLEGQNTGFGSDLMTTKAVKIQQNVDIDTSSMAAFISTMSDWFVSLHGVFLMLSLIQGLFAGLIIGKLSEGDLMAGFKHSLILMTIAFLIISFAQGV